MINSCFTAQFNGPYCYKSLNWSFSEWGLSMVFLFTLFQEQVDRPTPNFDVLCEAYSKEWVDFWENHLRVGCDNRVRVKNYCQRYFKTGLILNVSGV